MKNAEQIRKRLEDVKKMKSYTDALNALSDITYGIGIDACEERTKMREDIELLRKFILGNGSPEDSMISRLVGLEKCMMEYSDDIRKIKDRLLGKMDSEEDGIISKMEATDKKIDQTDEKLDKLNNTLTWIARLLGGAVAVELIIQLFKLAF